MNFIFYHYRSFVAEKMKGKRRKKWFFFFFEVDNFSFSLSFSDGLFGCRVKQREWKGKRKWKEFYDFRLELYDDIAWESVWLPRTKQRRKKSFFFLSLRLCLVAEKWILWLSLQRKWKERTGKVIFELFNFYFKSFEL